MARSSAEISADLTRALDGVTATLKVRAAALKIVTEAITHEDFVPAVVETRAAMEADFAEEPFEPTAENLAAVQERRDDALNEITALVAALVVADEYIAQFRAAAAE